MQSEAIPALSPRRIDLLIVGAGPAGLALANWFRDSNVRVLLIDQKPGPTQRGAAEGLKSTTCEIFESFGIGSQIWAEAWRLEEIAIWESTRADGTSSAANQRCGIRRQQVMADCVPELGKPRECMLQQARVEWHMFQNLSSSQNIEIQWSSTPTSLTFDNSKLKDSNAHPVKVTVARSIKLEVNGANSAVRVPSMPLTTTVNGSQEHEESYVEQIEARYIAGCDGAHSWVRRQLGVKLEGDLTDSVFGKPPAGDVTYLANSVGVMDIIPKSNFPDIRRVCYLKAKSGTILLVPRSNKEVRLYIPVESGGTLSDPKDLTFERILEAAKTIIAPYELDVAKCSWWSAYRVGQRVGDHFTMFRRAFLAGDAVHTHSPKAGQGMNTSIQDAYNLGWKLRLVLLGHAPASILETYESERRPVAQDLIAFDRGYLKLFSAPASTFDSEFLHAMKFTTGLSIRYSPSNVVQLPRGQTIENQPPSLLKADLVPGKRLPDFQIVNQADATTTRVHQRLGASGKFRIVVFAGDLSEQNSFDRLQKLGKWLADLGHVVGKAVTSTKSTIETLVIHRADRHRVELMELHEVFRPWNDESGWDYWRVYADAESAHEGHGKVYERLEIDENCYAIIVRPDGYVGAIASIDNAEDELSKYFISLELRA